jgi:hypothetical protein
MIDKERDRLGSALCDALWEYSQTIETVSENLAWGYFGYDRMERLIAKRESAKAKYEKAVKDIEDYEEQCKAGEI